MIAKALIAARSAGWNVPFFTPGAGADPVVRQSLADHSDWVDGLTFASGRLTAEEGPTPFYAFSSKYRNAFGVEEVGVKTHAATRSSNRRIGMYAFDSSVSCSPPSVSGGADDRARVLQKMNR